MTEFKSPFPGRNGFKVAASPLMYSVIENALAEVNPQKVDF